MDNFRAILEQLDGWKLTFVYELSKSHSLSEAFRAAGVGKSTYYKLPDEEQQRLSDLADAIRRNRIELAQPTLDAAAKEAVNVLVSLLTARHDYIKLQAAQTILDRTLGQVTKRVDLTSAGEGIQIQFVGMITDEDDPAHLPAG